MPFQMVPVPSQRMWSRLNSEISAFIGMTAWIAFLD
jgi:hypothetical protein